MTMLWLCIKLVGGGRATKLRNLLNVDAVLDLMRQITIFGLRGRERGIDGRVVVFPSL
jgi:hypothetical protein